MVSSRGAPFSSPGPKIQNTTPRSASTPRIPGSEGLCSPRVVNDFSPAIREFLEWVENRKVVRGDTRCWEIIRQIFYENDKHVYVLDGVRTRKGLTAEEWTLAMKIRGFEGDSVEVFHEIAAVEASSQDTPQSLNSRGNQRRPTIRSRIIRHSDDEKRIKSADFQRFERRVAAWKAFHQEYQEAGAFLNALLRMSGTVLRTWRLDIDRRGAGVVGYQDFIEACRRVGVTGQARQLWEELCRGGSGPLEFKDLSPQEAANLEEFVKALVQTVGACDVERGWATMDLQRQNWLTYEEFKEGCFRLGFKGNVKLLFNGLKPSRELNRVNREDFLYIQKVTRHQQSKLSEKPFAVRELIEWVNREQGGTEAFVTKLGLQPDSDKTLSVKDLEAYLTALGFDGDARDAASQAARYQGGNLSGSAMTYSGLGGLLHGDRRSVFFTDPTALQALTAKNGSKPGSRSTTPRRRTQSTPRENSSQQQWNNELCDFSAVNNKHSKWTKVEAWKEEPAEVQGGPVIASARQARGASGSSTSSNGTPRTPRTTHRVPVASESRRAARSVSPAASETRIKPSTALLVRPSWDESLDLKSMRNAKLPAGTRHYFSDPTMRTAKEKVRHSREKMEVVLCSQPRRKGPQKPDTSRKQPNDELFPDN